MPNSPADKRPPKPPAELKPYALKWQDWGDHRPGSRRKPKVRRETFATCQAAEGRKQALHAKYGTECLVSIQLILDDPPWPRAAERVTP